MIRKDAQDVI